jgi:hypothetical protein
MNPVVAISVRILEVLFFVGWIGSAVVILLAGIEDMHTVLKGHEPEEQQ